jgi:Ca2+-binding EF-hand superfamily protein
VFDKKQIGEVDYEEFVCGLAVTCRGSWEEKVEFIFNIYDVHSVGAVSREELTALVSHLCLNCHPATLYITRFYM